MSIYESPITGILEINDRRARLRNYNLEIPQVMIKELNLRNGDEITGYTRQGKVYKIKKVNGLSPSDSQKIIRFENLPVAHPTQRIILEDGNLETRILDLVAPIAKGQRAIIIAQPRAGKTILLKKIAQSIVKNNPEIHPMALLVMERPEELIDFQEIEGLELFSSTFDQTNQHHVSVSRNAIEKAKRLVEQGKDVVLLLDSLTRLTRACNVLTPSHGKLLSGGLDANALQFPKELFGAARNIKNNKGSLTILATCLSETESKLDDAVLLEFVGTGNSEIYLNRDLADKKLFPALDVKKSGTRRDELMLHSDEKTRMDKLRNILCNCSNQEAIQLLRQKLNTFKTNAEFLMNLT
jgi:transcription termination factor Rho